jgi:hypothetical protein
MKEIKKRIVDNHLPRWLHSKILCAVDFIWAVKDDDERTRARGLAVANKLSGEEMCWVMMLLTLPKLNKILLKSDVLKDFTEKKEAERTVH